MGILMPALSRARKQGRDVYCLNSLRQLGIAVQMYAEECDGVIPRALDNLDARWILVFTPFLGEQYRAIDDYRKVDIYQCPSFPRDGMGSNNIRNAEQTVDYVVNAWDMDKPSVTNGQKGLQVPDDRPTKLHSIQQPSQRIYLADNEAGNWRPVIPDRQRLDAASNLNVLDVWSVTHMANADQGSGNLHRRVAQDRHRNKGCNNLFFDGHVEWLKAEDNTAFYWCGVNVLP